MFYASLGIDGANKLAVADAEEKNVSRIVAIKRRMVDLKFIKFYDILSPVGKEI